jgi:hypothetical protein
MEAKEQDIHWTSGIGWVFLVILIDGQADDILAKWIKQSFLPNAYLMAVF